MSFRKHIKASVQHLEAYSVKSKPLSPELIKLNQNENPFDIPMEIKRELVEELFRQPWNRYPDVFPSALTESLAQFTGIPAGNIIAANGSNELMYTILMAIVSKGTKVLIPTPTFFLYEKIVRVMEGELLSVPAVAGLQFDVERIIEVARKEKPALIILNSPNSPTGQMLPAVAVERIIVETDSIVLVDEAYIEFADQPSILPLLERYDRLIVLRTFSKAFSLAGLRIGYLLAQPAMCSELLKPKIPFTVNNFSSSVAMTLMRHRRLIDERIIVIKKEKQRIYEALRQIQDLQVFPSQTNFLIFTVQKDAKALFEKLLTANILIRDVSSYPMLENTLRVNAGTVDENNTFLAVLKKYLHN